MRGFTVSNGFGSVDAAVSVADAIAQAARQIAAEVRAERSLLARAEVVALAPAQVPVAAQLGAGAPVTSAVTFAAGLCGLLLLAAGC